MLGAQQGPYYADLALPRDPLIVTSRTYTGLEAGGTDGGGDLLGIGGNGNPAEPAFARPARHMHDHRLARDLCHRLAGQAGRGHAGGDDDDWVHRTPFLRATR
jgi:hypothetical protein